MGDLEEVRKGLFSEAHRLFNAVDGMMMMVVVMMMYSGAGDSDGGK